MPGEAIVGLEVPAEGASKRLLQKSSSGPLSQPERTTVAARDDEQPRLRQSMQLPNSKTKSLGLQVAAAPDLRLMERIKSKKRLSHL